MDGLDKFGINLFGDSAMREYMTEKGFKAYKNAVAMGKQIDYSTACEVADAMKNWATDRGATHFTHWFQPMTGVTAEKHESFLSPSKDGGVINELTGKELIHGESDASSFPSGGLRATFEARGYTAWDPTSPAFLKDNTLCIPTAFCSYGGHALDKKTPLLRSMTAVSTQAMRILKLFGHKEVKSVKTTVGAEQEYFLIDVKAYEKRKDLVYTGRTLFGARSPKGQELADHFFGALKPRVMAFMSELDRELWKVGVLAKTEHNEVAPAQHELAPMYTTTNIAADGNQLTMELAQKIARKHGMVCILHDKPFEGINGSGKHNNWSMSTDTGVNLLEPGDTPYDNAQFLLFLCAVIKAVDEYQDLLRLSVATAANDHRLGGDEAPPAIVSVFLGDELTEILEALENDLPYGGKEKEMFKLGTDVLPYFPKDTTDRNRTSPFAFTGNKFEFRMPGASASISCPNMMINTAVAEELRQFADELESATDFKSALHALIKRVIKEHKRIIFNGNNYGKEWLEESQKRGLVNAPTTPDALSLYTQKKNIELFERHKVLKESEIRSRQEILLDNYNKILNIESLTMINMAKRDILPSISKFSYELASTAKIKEEFNADASYEKNTLSLLATLTGKTAESVGKLEKLLDDAKGLGDTLSIAYFVKNNVVPTMKELREYVDQAESLTDGKYWPYPSYDDILFSVK